MVYNRILEHIILPPADVLLKTNFLSELKKWRNKTAFLNETELLALQKQNLSKLLQHAVLTIPYYRDMGIGLTGDPYTDIKKFPLLTKRIIKKNADALCVIQKEKLVVERSSGSSGEQGEIYMSKKERSQCQAAQTFLWQWSGYHPGDTILQTGMTLNRGFVKSIKDRLFRTHYVSAFNLSEDKICKELKNAAKKGCIYFGGFAASLNSYAKVAIDKNIPIRFKGVIVWGDKLFDEYKRNIKNAFGSPVITELYGTSEGHVISGTCVYGAHHVLTPHVFIELLNKDGNEVDTGELGYVVATRLDGLSFPLIRYYLGDLAVKESSSLKCPCGSNFPMLKKVVGRDTDIVQTPSGKDLIVHFFTGIFEHFESIQQFKIIQKEKGGIEIEYIPAVNFSTGILAKIEQRIFELAEEKPDIKWKSVNSIAATASGKPQIIENFIAPKMV